MEKILIKGARITNEGISFEGDVFIEKGIVVEISKSGISKPADKIIDAGGLHLLPGVIDDQVHFREPGLMHKAEIATESRAAVAGGTTTFMEMPNTIPNALDYETLEWKYQRAAQCSPANFSFFLGASNNNLEEVKKVNVKNVCGVKIFMGSSTGNMLVDNEKALEGIFKNCPTLIATHCEDEATIQKSYEFYKEKYGNNIPPYAHPLIRNAEGCLISSQKAVNLAKQYNSRLHVLHISTETETHLFGNDRPLKDKLITAEACVHHLWFSDQDYATLGNLIKCNPAIKTLQDREGVWKALLDNRIDIVATDHAPHTSEEKDHPYEKSPSGLPLVQHSLLMALQWVNEGKWSIEKMVEKMSHAPAECFKIENRGYIREGYFADLVLVNPNKKADVKKENLLYKCGWSPLEGHVFNHSIEKTIVNGNIVFENGKIQEGIFGSRLTFDR